MWRIPALLTLTIVSFAGLLVGGPPAAAERTVRMEGTYLWTLGSTEERSLNALFVRKGGVSESGEPGWSVSFQFRMNNRNQTWRGTAEGSLEQGTLRGTVEDGRRTWVFEGEVVGGVFQGTHAERKRSGRLQPSGSLSLTRR